MSGGNWCLVKPLGLVKGGKGLRHHEVMIDFSAAAFFRMLWRLMRGRSALAPTTLEPLAPSPHNASTASSESLSRAA